MYGNRIRWAQDRLKRAGLSVSARRGVWKATNAGLALAAEHPAALPVAEVERIADAEPNDSALNETKLPRVSLRNGSRCSSAMRRS